ncbi:MAG: hypothetical protein WAM78_13475, partial [Candidatus Sulfotelmatobacter sp.]
ADPAPRQALLRFLVERSRFDEAFDLTEASLHYAPRDANLLLDRGLLAMRRGHPEIAVDSWTRAVAIDPSQMLAQLYLASELDHEGRPDDAALHYKAFLGDLADHPGEKRPEPQKVIAVALRMADCQARASQAKQAVQSYELAAKIAAQTKQTKLESIAEVNEAALQAQAGKTEQALPLYQHSLQLDESIGDQTSSAEDWLAYGRFLESAGFPARMAYACFVKAASLRAALPDASQRQFLTDVTERTEKLVGAEASAIRRNPEPVLQEVLALKR